MGDSRYNDASTSFNITTKIKSTSEVTYISDGQSCTKNIDNGQSMLLDSPECGIKQNATFMGWSSSSSSTVL